MQRKSLVHVFLAVLLVTTQVGCSRKTLLTGADAKAMFQAQRMTSLDGLIDQAAVPEEYLIRRKGVAYLDSPEAFAEKNGLKFIKQIAGLGVEAFQTADPSTLTALQQAGEIEFIEPNYIRRLTLPQQSGQQQVSPLMAQNTASWMSNPGRNHIYIGLVDTGVDSTHPDLKGKVMPAHNTLGTAGGVDDNGHETFWQVWPWRRINNNKSWVLHQKHGYCLSKLSIKTVWGPILALPKELSKLLNTERRWLS